MAPGIIMEETDKKNVKTYEVGGAGTPEQSLVSFLLENGLKISCAESCTGGMLSSRLINVPGISEVYKEGFITYSNEAKQNLLGVKPETIDKYGAVSAETAAEMAKGLADVTKADVCISVTGNAGPDASEGKPVGLVFIGCCIKGKVSVTEERFSGSRNRIRESATETALEYVKNNLMGTES